MTFSQKKRLFEMIPGVLIWTTLILSVVFSVLRPLWMVYFIILFDLYWLFRIFYFTPFLLISWWRFRGALKRDWQADVEKLPQYKQLNHVIFLPFVKESVEVIRETLQTLSQCRYPAKRIVVVLAGEGRFGEHYHSVVKTILPEFAETFRAILTTEHPSGLPNEIPGKGSNLNYSGHAVLPELLRLGCDPDWTVVSSFDVDTIVHPQYFSCVTYQYLTIPEPTRSSYQPVALYNNNLWESPAVVRVVMFGTTFWLLQEIARPEGMMTFASHSMSLRMLIDVGFWQKDIVSEDSRIFLQAFVRYHGEYRVTPIHLPVSMDTVMAGNYWKALPALYKQLRRWAWGMENFPFMMATIWEDKAIPRWRRFAWIFKQVEGGYTWATASLLIFIVGYLPFWIAPDALRAFAVFQNTPFTLQWLMRLSMLGLFVSAGLSLTLLPPPPAHLPRPYAYLIGAIQWIMLPISFILFGAFPAIDAQTRLMLGKPLGFNVSPKRKSTP